MRRRIAAPLVFAAAVTAVLFQEDAAPRAAAQEKPSTETVTTADGVQLTGEFSKAPKGTGNDPVVVLLYPPGIDRTMEKGNWKGLAAELNEAGYHVFRFDWRGHGNSKVVKGNTFWTNNFTGAHNTKYIKGSQKKPGTINVKDFSPQYFPLYVNDLAAVRAHLDQKNDNNDLNTSSIYLVGGDEAAALGFMWLTAEWSKPAVYAPQPTVPGYEVLPDPRFPSVRGNPALAAGANYAGCIWLSPNRPNVYPEATVREWVKTYAADIRENNPMLFLYGDKDATGKRQAEFLFNEVLVANPRPGNPLKKLEQTFISPVKDAGALKGGNLLGNDAKFQTETTIKKYLAALQKERAKVARKQRTYSAPYYVNLDAFGLRLP
jgi:pimeloyl-ACP methyl ester carboxylesterase